MKGKYYIEVWNEDTKELNIQSKFFDTAEEAEAWYHENIVTTNACGVAVMQDIQLSDAEDDTDIRMIKLLDSCKEKGYYDEYLSRD